VQLVALKVPVEFEVNVTVPVGVIAPVAEVSATVTVHVLGVLSRTLAVQDTVVLAVLMVDVSVKLPLLPL